MHWSQVLLLSYVHRRTTLSETCSKPPESLWTKMRTAFIYIYIYIYIHFFLNGFGVEYLDAAPADARKAWLVKLPESIFDYSDFSTY